jgi:signal transduction histidine kinase
LRKTLAPYQLWRFRHLALCLVGLILFIYGGAIYLVTRHLRQQIRQQMIARDAEVLQGVALLQETAPREAAAGLSLAEPSEQLALLLRISKLKGVIAARLYDAQGIYVTAFPAEIAAGSLSLEDRQTLRELNYHSRYYEQAKVANLFAILPAALADPHREIPLMEVLLPLHEAGKSDLLGGAQFFIDAQALSLKLRQLDRDLLAQSLTVFAVGGAIILFGLGGTLRRLQRKHLELLELTDHLARANQELALAAKTTAVGAVAAHLIHGLKNPLFGLHHLISSGALADAKQGTEGWRTAENATRDLLAMIDASARILKNEQALYQTETRLAQVIKLVSDKFTAELAARRVTLVENLEADAVLGGHLASLAALVMENLLRNAIQATPEGGRVYLRVSPAKDAAAISVRDEGPGYPPNRRKLLFLPCQSTKPGGLGIGLAISKQIANHLGARLELAETPPPGCTFVFSLPVQPLPAPGTSGNSSKMGLAAVAVLP